MEKQFDLTEINSNLYGPTATGMMGGSKTNYNMFGGAILNASRQSRKIKGGGYETVAYPEYIKYKDFHDFMMAFYLIRKISHTPSAGVYIIPPRKELDNLIADFHKRLNKEKIDIGSEDAFKYAATNNLPYKRYIFTVFGGDNAHYKLDKEPPYKNFETVKRINLASEVMYFKYVSDEEIKICNTSECTKGTTAKLVAKCNNGIYVFQGNIPDAVETKTKNSAKFIGAKRKKPKKKTVRKLEDDDDDLGFGFDDEKENETMTGGAFDNNFNDLKKQLLFNNVDNEEQAMDFVSSMALADYEVHGDESIKKYAKFISGDPIHSAFRIAFNKSCDVVPDEAYNAEDLNEMCNRLVQEYKPSNKEFDRSKYSSMFKSVYKNITKQNLDPIRSTKAYKQAIISKFSKIGIDMLKADVATSLFRSGQSISTAYKYADLIDNEVETGDSNISHLEYSGTDGSVSHTSKFNYIINKALLSAPLIGLNARTYVPILKSAPKFKSVFNKRTTLKGGFKDSDDSSDDENNNNDDDELKEEIPEDDLITDFNKNDNEKNNYDDWL